MNRKTLQKVIDELKKEDRSIPYALGILETIMDSLPEEHVLPVHTPTVTMRELPLGGSAPIVSEIPIPATDISVIKRMTGE